MRKNIWKIKFLTDRIITHPPSDPTLSVFSGSDKALPVSGAKCIGSDEVLSVPAVLQADMHATWNYPISVKFAAAAIKFAAKTSSLQPDLQLQPKRQVRSHSHMLNSILNFGCKLDASPPKRQVCNHAWNDCRHVRLLNRNARNDCSYAGLMAKLQKWL